MAEQSDVKVFISWSGDLAKSVALALHGWLPMLFDRVVPWVSDLDIAAGQRSLTQIEGELAGTNFGVVVVTAENQHAPWLNFEAGALSKTVAADTEHRVVPLLVDLTSPADLTGPLSQFQAKMARQEGIRDVLRSLAVVAGIDEALASRRFDAYWPQLETKIDSAKAAASTDAAVPERREAADVLDEILLHVRSLRSDVLTSPHSELRPTAVQQDQRNFQKFATDLAAAHGMEVFSIEGPAFGDREVTVSPKGMYSEDAEQAIRKAFDDQTAASRQKVKITVVPF